MNPETIVLAAILLAAGVGLARALHLDARWRRERDAVDAAKAEAAHDAASGLTAARLRHPSVRAKESSWNS